MKCLIISGSPSKSYQWDGKQTGSFTAKLTEHAAGVMNLMGEVEYAEIRLADVKIPPCVGCYRCFTYGEQYCPHAKQVQPIAALMREADALIFSSPVYVMNVTGTMKNFIDHMAYYCHRPFFFGKKAMVVSSTGGGGAKKVCKILAETLDFWGYAKVYRLPVTRMAAVDPNPKMIEKTTKVAEKLYEDIVSGRAHQPSIKKLFYFAIWQAMNSNEDALEADVRYWRDAGLTQGYYPPVVKLNPFKKVCAVVIQKLARLGMRIMRSRE
jgi:multimeric flavodoxin WrbA